MLHIYIFGIVWSYFAYIILIVLNCIVLNRIEFQSSLLFAPCDIKASWFTQCLDHHRNNKDQAIEGNDLYHDVQLYTDSSNITSHF